MPEPGESLEEIKRAEAKLHHLGQLVLDTGPKGCSLVETDPVIAFGGDHAIEGHHMARAVRKPTRYRPPPSHSLHVDQLSCASPGSGTAIPRRTAPAERAE